MSFYWRQSRENLFSPAGIRIFQLAYANKDKPYEEARKAIDAEYEKLSPRLKTRGGAKKHGGIFATYMTFLEEMGLMHRTDVGGVSYLKSTPAGDQANTLLSELPEVLRIVPYFVLELLSRYRFNNPYNKSPKNAALASAIEEQRHLSLLVALQDYAGVRGVRYEGRTRQICFQNEEDERDTRYDLAYKGVQNSAKRWCFRKRPRPAVWENAFRRDWSAEIHHRTRRIPSRGHPARG